MDVCPCGVKVKPNAVNCPSCGKRLISPYTRMFACRKCGTKLVRGDHYLRGFRSPVADGGSKMAGFYHQRPCLECGEPEPYPPSLMKIDAVIRAASWAGGTVLALALLYFFFAG